MDSGGNERIEAGRKPWDKYDFPNEEAASESLTFDG